MADFTPVALGIKPPEGISLSDMVNIARGAQAFRQAEQVNPLALEQAQETTKQQKLKTETDTMGLQQKRFKHIADSQISMINNPLVIAAEQNPSAVDPAKLADLVKRNGMTTAKALGIPQDQAEGFLAPYVDLATTNPAALRQYYKERHIQGLDEASRTSALSSSGIGVNTGAGGYTVQTGEFGPQPVGTVVRGTKYTAEMAPGVIEVNGVKYKLDAKTQNLVPVSAAVPAVVGASGAGGAAGAGGQVKPSTSGLVKQDMPVASGGIPQMNTQQTARYEEGQAIQKESTSLAQAAQEAKQTSRKIKENIAAAAGSAPGQALRSAGKFIAGSEQLDELIKNLADNQMRQAALMGASSATDQARQVVALANGSENITPQALAQIVQRADATSTALEKFNTGLNNYFDKAGTYNGPIHARNFKQAWAENYDPRIFMVQNINASDMSKAEKQGQLQLVLKGTTDEERRALAKKAETIKRLERGDF